MHRNEEELPIEVSPIIRSTNYNYRREVFYVGTTDGREMKLHLPENQFERGSILPGTLVNYTSAPEGARFVSFAAGRLPCQVGVARHYAGTTKFAKIYFNFAVTDENKRLMENGVSFEIRHESVGRITINIEKLAIGLRNCRGYNRLSKLTPGLTIFGSAEFVYDEERVRYGCGAKGELSGIGSLQRFGLRPIAIQLQ